MGSLQYTLGRPDDRLHVQREAGYGGKLGGALQLRYDGEANRISLEARHQPQGFSSLGLGRPHGTFLDGAWNGSLTPRLTLDVTSSFAHHELPLFQERSATAAAELRYHLDGAWSLRTGANAGSFDAGSHGGSVRSITVPLGVAYDVASAGVSALVRYQQNSARSEGGVGGRLALRGSWASLRGSLFGDYQRDAATVDLVLRQDPALAQALAELGLAARTPEELARILRENSALAALGFVEGLSINLHP